MQTVAGSGWGYPSSMAIEQFDLKICLQRCHLPAYRSGCEIQHLSRSAEATEPYRGIEGLQSSHGWRA